MRSIIYYLLLSKVILNLKFIKLRRLYSLLISIFPLGSYILIGSKRSGLVPLFLVLDYLAELYIAKEIELDISSKFNIVGRRFSNILKRSLIVR